MVDTRLLDALPEAAREHVAALGDHVLKGFDEPIRVFTAMRGGT